MRICVLAGGRTPERDVSLRSGHRVTASLVELGHEAELIDPGETPLAEALQERAPDLCYLSLHGKEGEDGTVQRLLDLLNIPYTGTAAFDCEVAFDKVLAKDALSRAGVRTPDWVTIEGWALRDLGAGAALGAAVERVGLPCVVKPSRSGSALGVGFVERGADLPNAVMAALAFSGAAVVEAKVDGTEVAAGLVGDPAEASTAGRDRAQGRGVRLRGPLHGRCHGVLRSRTPLPRCRGGQRGGGGAGGGRRSGRGTSPAVDLIVDRQGQPWVLEVNVSPGMTETSLLPMAAHAAGMGMSDLCDRVLQAAIARG